MLASAGCSVLASTDDERAAAPPTTPEIRIEPESPITSDDLRWVLVAPSEIRGAEVEYEVEWLVDGDAYGNDDVVPHTSTARGESWTVRVTPRAGALRGETAEVSVLIANAPPVIETVGFDSYRPITQDALEAFPVATDADGDAITFRYRWIRNASIPVPSATTATIALGDRGFVGNDTVELEVAANDGVEDGEVYRTTALPVTAAVTGWRPLSPSRTQYGGGSPNRTSIGDQYGMVLDADDHRLVYFAPQGYSTRSVWEIPLDRPGASARLVPEGVGPSNVTVLVEDPSGRRALAIDRSGRVYELTLERGKERWRRLSASDATPNAEFDTLRQPSVLLDEARDRLILTGGESRGLFQHSLASDGGTWTILSTSNSAPLLTGSAWLHEPGADVAYLVGGAPAEDPENGDGWVGGTNAVWSLALDAPSWTRLEAADAPSRVVWPATAIDSESRTAYVLEGAEDVDVQSDESYTVRVQEGQDEIHAFDFASERWTTLVSPGTTDIPARSRGTASWDPVSRRVLYSSGAAGSRWRTDVLAVHPDGRREAIESVGTNIPPPVYEAGFSTYYAFNRGLLTVGGAVSTDEGPTTVTDEVWVYDFARDRFQRVTMAPDPQAGAPPPAAGMSRSVSGSDVFFGGRSAAGQLFADTWRITFASATHGTWQRIATSGPSARASASVLNTASIRYLVFGGLTPSASTETWRRDCPDDSCAWNAVLTGGSQPPSNAFLGEMQEIGLQLVAVGRAGLADLGVHTYLTTTPHAGATWTQATVSLAAGTTSAPAPREGFSVSGVYDMGAIRFLVCSEELCWELRYAGGWSWSRVTPTVPASGAYVDPPSLSHHAAGWDSARRRLVSVQSGAAWELRYAP